MNHKELFTKKRIIFLLLFILLVYLSNKVNFSALVGEPNQFFTLYQFFGPVAGGFLGSIFGTIAVLLAQLIDFVIVGKQASLINIVRLAPMVFAAIYFAVYAEKTTKNKMIQIIIPIICIAAFILHPIGRQVWFFSLYWLIPIVGALIPEKWRGALLWRSYGATFTAHAVGGTLWIYSVPMTAEAWSALIPIVAFERFLFGAGIAGSYVVMNTILDVLADKFEWAQKVAMVDKRYVVKFALSK